MTSKNSPFSWSDLPLDLVPQFFARLEIIDFIRFSAVCRPWNQARISGNCRPKPSKLPWLMFSSPDDPDSRYFYSLTEQKMRRIHLPMISGRRLIGSSSGFLVSISDQALVCITSPLTGAHYDLPSPVTLPNFDRQVNNMHDVVRDPSTGLITNYLSWQEDGYGGRELSDVTDFICKYVFSKSFVVDGSDGKPTVFVTYGADEAIAFARPGDTSWKKLNTDDQLSFYDIILHKGRLHAVNFKGTVLVYDDINLSCDPSFVTTDGPLRRCCGNDRRYLVESPDGKDLYLIGRETRDVGDPRPFNRTVRFMVFLLNESSNTWTPVADVGDMAFFLGFNGSMALSVKEFPELKRNCIYFTDDMDLIYVDAPELAGDMGICDLGDGSMHPLLPSTIDCERLNWPPALWFTPVPL